jgi:hypothetical protein
VAIQGQRINISRVNYSDMEGGDKYTGMFHLTSAKMEELPSMVGPFLHQETNQSHVLSEKQLPQIALHWLGSKSKAIPLQASTGPEGSRRFRLPDFKTIGM